MTKNLKIRTKFKEFEDKIYYLDLSNLEVIVEETESDFIQIFMKLAFNR